MCGRYEVGVLGHGQPASQSVNYVCEMEEAYKDSCLDAIKSGAEQHS